MSSTGTDTDGCTNPSSPCARIGYALAQAAASDTVLVAAGTYTEANIPLSKSIAIRGAGPTGSIIQAAASAGVATSRVFTTVGTGLVVTLDGLLMRYGQDTRGGALYVSNCIVFITNCAFRNNTIMTNAIPNVPGGPGGAIYSYGGAIEIVSSVIASNRAGNCLYYPYNPNSFPGGDGGGVYVLNGPAVLQKCTITDNAAGDGDQTTYIDPLIPPPASRGGAGGGVSCASGTLSITDCIIASNRAGTGSRAVVHLWKGSGGTGGGGGGIFALASTTTIARCTVSGNVAGRGGDTWEPGQYDGGTGGMGGGVCSVEGLLSISNSSFISNAAGTGGHGSYDTYWPGNGGNGGDGGGIAVRGILEAVNVTATGNRAGVGGTRGYRGYFDAGQDGIAGNGGCGGGMAIDGAASVRHCTIVSNSVGGAGSDNGEPGSGGGLYVADGSTVYVGHTIVARNVTNDASGSVSSLGYDLFSTTNGLMLLNVSSNLIGMDPKVLALADNGGPTLTHALAANSPARNGGDPAFNSTTILTDQRGHPRVMEGRTDIGAYEFGVPSHLFIAQNGTDAGFCADPLLACATLAYAQEQAASTCVIEVAAGTYTAADIAITKNLTIRGAGPTDTFIQAAYSLAASTSRVIRIAATGLVVTLDGMTMRYGQADRGGGIYASNCTLFITNCVIRDNATVDGEEGPWPPVTPIPGGPGGAIYSVMSTVQLLNSLVISNRTGNGWEALYDAASAGGDGGGLYARGGTVVIQGSTVTACRTGGGGGGLGVSSSSGGRGGGVYCTNTVLRVLDSSIVSNVTGVGGTGQPTLNVPTPGGSGGGGGGICVVNGTATVTRTTVADNLTGNGGEGGSGPYLTDGGSGGTGGAGGGILAQGGFLFISSTLFYANNSGGGGPGGDGFTSYHGGQGGSGGAGGGVAGVGRIEIANSTFDSNESGNGAAGGSAAATNLYGAGGSGGHGGGVYATGTLVLAHCTFVTNRAGAGASPSDPAGAGGGLYVTGTVAAAIGHTILYGNSPLDGAGRINSLGYSLLGSTNGLQLTNQTSSLLVSVDPLLFPLAANGGPTWTRSPNVSSPTINAGDPVFTPTQYFTDQRGAPRVQEGRVDIGAFEFDELDQDGDGMPDYWELLYGLNPTNSGDAHFNADSDAYDNVQEFWAGTSPQNADDFLQVKAITNAARAYVAFGPCAPNRLYTLQFTDSLMDGEWNNLPGQTDVIGDGSALNILSDPAETSTSRVYRVRVRMP